jgi:thioredoxin
LLLQVIPFRAASTRKFPEMGNIFGRRNELADTVSINHFSSVTEREIMGFLLSRAALFAAVLFVTSQFAQAGQPFDAAAFRSSQAEGRAILVDVTAPWCPTCRQQRPIVQEIEKERPDLVVYEVDFDTAKDVLRQFRVQQQSTLIVFRGTSEKARSTGETSPAAIRELIAKAF